MIKERSGAKREHNLTAGLIGSLGICWTIAGGLPNSASLWSTLIRSTEHGDLWLVVMAIVSLLQVFGCSVRSYRHIGFYLGGVVWLSTFGLFAYRGVVTPGMMTCLIIGVVSMFALVDEVYSSVKYNKGKTHGFFATD